MSEGKPAVRERRSQSERRAESWEALVKAAAAIVTEEGVSAATFQAIGERAGYHRSLVTQRFGAKRGLVDAVIEYLEQSRETQFKGSHLGEISGLEALLRYTDGFLKDLATNPNVRAYFRLLASAVAEISDVRTAFAEAHERTRKRFEGFVLRGHADGSIRKDLDANAAALMVGSLRLGVAMQVLVDPDVDIEPIRKTTLDVLRTSFAAPAR